MITFGKKRTAASRVKKATKWDEFLAKSKDKKPVLMVDQQKPPLVPAENALRSSSRKKPADLETDEFVEVISQHESLNSSIDQTDLVSEVSAFDCIDQISPVKPKIRGRVKRMERLRPSPIKPVSIPREKVIKKAKENHPVLKIGQKFDEDFKAAIPLPVRRQSAVTYSRNGSLISSNPTAPVSSASNDLVSPIDQLFDALDQEEQEVTKFDEGLGSTSDDEKIPKIQGYHHLKTAGNSKRVLDETNYLLEGIFSTSLSIQRSSCFDIIKKLKQEDLSTSLRIHGQIKSLFSGLHDVQDFMIQTAMIFILGILVQKDLRNLEGIVDDVFMVWIIKSLEKYSKADQLVTLPKKRYDKILAQDFIALIKDYGLGVTTTEPLLFLSSKAMSIRGSSYVFSPSEDLALYLKKMIMYCRQIDHCLVLLEFAIGTPQSKKIESFCDAEFVCALWTNFKNEFGIYKLTTETRKQGKVDHLTRILRILINLHGPKYSIKDTKSDIQTLLLYFIICRKSVHEIGNLHEESYFDLQTHLLGLMTNLVENSDKEACSLASVKMSLDCGTTCVMKCKCRKKLDGLSILAAFFSSAFKVIQEKETDPSSSVFCAYIAILIANIVKHRIDDRPRIMMLLPDKSFDGVIQMLEEFTLFHAAVQEELKLDFEGGNYAQTSLKNLVEILRS